MNHECQTLEGISIACYLSQNKQLKLLNAFIEVSFFSHAWLPGKCKTTCVRKGSFPTGRRDTKWLTLSAGIIPEVRYNETTSILHSHFLTVHLLPQCTWEPNKDRLVKVKRSPVVLAYIRAASCVLPAVAQKEDERSRNRSQCTCACTCSPKSHTIRSPGLLCIGHGLQHQLCVYFLL